MELTGKMGTQLIILGVVALALGPEFLVALQKRETTSPASNCECKDLVENLIHLPYEKFNVTEFDCSLPRHTNPNISEILTIGKYESLSLVDVNHQTIMEKLIEVLSREKDHKTFLANAVFIREQVNPQFFHHAYIQALRNKIECSFKLTSYIIAFPEKFIDKNLLAFVADHPVPAGQRAQFCATPKPRNPGDPEEHISYFREDIGINIHHDSWHQIYPSKQAANTTFGENTHAPVYRRGELFYYMHQQLIARYNFERFVNDLKSVEALPIELHQKLPAYHCTLRSSKTQSYADRPANSELNDFHPFKSSPLVRIEDMKAHVKNIETAIQDNTIYNSNGTKSTLKGEEKFIDSLANLVEAVTPSEDADPKLYGNLHTYGHMAIAQCHNPSMNSTYIVEKGVMSDLATALNDPVFWRWHKRVDNIFTMHKGKLPGYTSKQLGFEGVTIKSFKVQTNNETAKENEFLTLEERSELDLSNGTKISAAGEIMYCYKHPQHYPFDYNIEVESDKDKTAIVRIFMAPTNDDSGKEFDFNKQREMFIEMDTFPQQLAKGLNQIKRRSIDSSVTTPSQQTFMRIPMDSKVQPQLPQKIIHSDCGLPDYLLVPRGTVQGLKTKLFVIISDYETDKVDGIEASEIDKHAAASFCGIAGKPYPFQRPMGFPFDRKHEENSLAKFSSLPNMRVIDATVRFLNITRPAEYGEKLTR